MAFMVSFNLARYNELGQPVCKVCNIAAKSESLWPAHLASRQHKEVSIISS